jgi:hypothetical protein
MSEGETMSEGDNFQCRTRIWESARPNMWTGSGFVFVDHVDTKIRVYAHVNKSSTGTGFVHVYGDCKGEFIATTP